MTQSHGSIPKNASSQINGQRALLQALLQRAAVDVLHDEVVEPGLALYPVDGNDVGMIELGRRLGFLLEAMDHLGVVRGLRRKHLDRHLPLEHQVLRQEHHGHATPAEQSDDLIAAGQSAGQTVLQLIGWIGRDAMRDFPRRRSAVGTEPSIRGEWRMAPGALAHRAPLCPTGPTLGIPTTGWYIGLQALMRGSTRRQTLW